MDRLSFIVQQVNKLNDIFFSIQILIQLGVGRTGVFLTLSIVLERIRYEGVVDVFQTVKLLRTQRPALVQTEVKFPLIFLTEFSFDSFRININSVIVQRWNI